MPCFCLWYPPALRDSAELQVPERVDSIYNLLTCLEFVLLPIIVFFNASLARVSLPMIFLRFLFSSSILSRSEFWTLVILASPLELPSCMSFSTGTAVRRQVVSSAQVGYDYCRIKGLQHDSYLFLLLFHWCLLLSMMYFLLRI